MTHIGFTVWFTGLSGAGKTTLAGALSDRLRCQGRRVEVLDGDDLRATLNSDLGFTKDARDANVRRTGFIAQLLSRNGVIALVALISPYRALRDEVRRNHEAPFIEVFVDCSLDEAIRRDRKGLYRRALSGEIPHFTGVSDPYEPSLKPDVHLHTDAATVEDCVRTLISALACRKLISE